jgi:cephalosporin hydroxylase
MGKGCGGSAMFYASICELLGEGRVITIDIEGRVDYSKVKEYEWSDRIHFLHGGSTNPLIVDEVYSITGYKDLEKFYYGNGALVLLDSWHTKEHVKQEMAIYSKFVHVDSYMIIEDTHANGHPVPWEHDNDGPYEAVEDWLKLHGDYWQDDYECEKHLLTFNPKGYLKRIK